VSPGKGDVHRAPGQLVVLLLFAAVGPGVVLLLARGTDGRSAGDLLLLAERLMKVKRATFKRTVNDTSCLRVDTGLVQTDADVG